MAATVNGTIKALSAGGAANAKLKFDYLSAPAISQGGLLKSVSFTTTADENGVFSVSDVAGGQYRITIDGSKADTWLIDVPDDSGSYNIVALLSPMLRGYNPSTQYVPNATSTVAGLVSLDSILKTGAASPSGTPASLLFWDQTGRALWINDNGTWTQLLSL
jgi:hypothetical protein